MKHTVPLFVALCALLSPVQATPVEIQISGTIDAGRAGSDPMNLINLAGLPYTMRILGDTTRPDMNPLPGSGAYYMVPAVIEIPSVGVFGVPPADALLVTNTQLYLNWAGGLEGIVNVSGAPGAFGNPDQMGPFAPLTFTSGAIVDFGGYGSMYEPSLGVWFDSKQSTAYPITVQAVARVPESTSTLWLLIPFLPCLVLTGCASGARATRSRS